MEPSLLATAFSVACRFGLTHGETLRWVNTAMALAMFIACLAVFAVKLRCDLCVPIGCRTSLTQRVEALMGLRFTKYGLRVTDLATCAMRWAVSFQLSADDSEYVSAKTSSFDEMIPAESAKSTSGNCLWRNGSPKNPKRYAQPTATAAARYSGLR